MCLKRPECQRCQTCGMKKYQLWVGPGMHDPGCPWGYERMDACPDAVNHAKLIKWCNDNGTHVTGNGLAFVAQMEATGVDLTQPPVEWVLA